MKKQTTWFFFFPNAQWSVDDRNDKVMVYPLQELFRSAPGPDGASRWELRKILNETLVTGFQFYITTTRYSYYYFQNLIVPVIVNSAVGTRSCARSPTRSRASSPPSVSLTAYENLCIVTGFCAVFMPSGSGEKTNLVLVNLLGFFAIQEIIATHLPKDGNVPRIAMYTLLALVCSTFNLAACILVVALNSIGLLVLSCT